MKKKRLFNASMTLEQLTYSGIFEAVEIRKQGYPFRLKHKMFYHRYLSLIKHLQETTSNTITINPDGHSLEGEQTSYREKIDNLISFFLKCNDAVHLEMGKTMVLYRAPQHRWMEELRDVITKKNILYLQCCVRCFLSKMYKNTLLKCQTLIIQSMKDRTSSGK